MTFGSAFRSGSRSPVVSHLLEGVTVVLVALVIGLAIWEADSGTAKSFSLPADHGSGPQEQDQRNAEGDKREANRPRRGPEDKTRRDFSSDCLASGCHAQLNKTPWVHSPVAVGACGVCHEAQGKAREHKFRPTRPKETLCSFCHRPPSEQKFTHKAFRDADCGGCHDPHGGATHHLLTTQDAGKLCGTCHKPHKPGEPAPADRKTEGVLDVSFAFAHAPFAEKKCLDCHKAHQSDHEKLLTLPERDLCLKCHPKVAENLGQAAHIHKPLETECRACHSSHGGDDRRLLHGKPRELCLSCHEKVLKAISENPQAHGALDTEESCLACHTSHSGKSKTLVAEPLGKACFKCHDRELTLPSGNKIANVQAEIASARFKHGPVAREECQGCHLSHSSPHQKLLSAKYPQGIYEEFTEPAFALCFSCHDKRLVIDERTTITSFRDGDRNLHYVHVKRKKGRTCGVCHEAHGSNQQGLVRESIPFGPGGWHLPIQFETTAKGGTCASGCHQRLSYDNSQPPGDKKAHLLRSSVDEIRDERSQKE